MSTYIKDSD